MEYQLHFETLRMQGHHTRDTFAHTVDGIYDKHIQLQSSGKAGYRSKTLMIVSILSPSVVFTQLASNGY